MKLGLIKEGKIPPDNRVALSPKQCVNLLENFEEVDLVVEPSSNRCYADEEYRDCNIPMSSNLQDCDVLFGIKEVPVNDLIPDKTYCFFSHTKKKQSYNQKLMMALIAKRIRLIDYEALTYDNGKRIIGFGFYAGVVGAHNALLTYGKKFNLFGLKPAHACKDMLQMTAQYHHIKFPPVKIVVTGGGRVTKGVVHIMNAMGIREVDPQDFLSEEYDEAVYTVLDNEHLYRNKFTETYNRDEFHEYPKRYECLFQPFLGADILINGIYWDKDIPRLFETADINKPEFKLKVIADITCDENGSVPINLGASTIADPVYGISKVSGLKVEPFVNDEGIIDIMAVDNLPNELPRDASESFGHHLTELVIPELLKDYSAILERATICENGQLGKYFQYLEDYAFPNETHKV